MAWSLIITRGRFGSLTPLRARSGIFFRGSISFVETVPTRYHTPTCGHPSSKKVGLSEIGTKFEQKKVDTYVCSEDMTREEIAPLGLIYFTLSICIILNMSFIKVATKIQHKSQNLKKNGTKISKNQFSSKLCLYYNFFSELFYKVWSVLDFLETLNLQFQW